MQRRRFLERFGIGAAVASAAMPATLSAQTVPTAADRNSVKAADFGAAGDGIKDDSDGIQRAIDAANALGGGTVFLEGTRGRNFRCGKPILLDDRRGVRLVGNSGPNALGGGQAIAQLVYTGIQGPFISLRSSHSITLDGLTIVGITTTPRSGAPWWQPTIVLEGRLIRRTFCSTAAVLWELTARTEQPRYWISDFAFARPCVIASS